MPLKKPSLAPSITKAQIKAIHAIKNALEMPDEHYRALLMRFGAESSKELTRNDAKEVIDILQELNDSMPKRDPNRSSENQLNYIKGLWVELSDLKDYDSLRNFVKKITGKFYLHIEIMSLDEAQKVLVALKNWERRVKKGY